MADENNLVWVNKKTGLNASKSELSEMWEKSNHDFELKEITQDENNKNLKTLSENNNIELKEPISGPTIAWAFIFTNSLFLLIGLPELVCCSIIVTIPLFICFLIWTQNEFSVITKSILIITFLFLLYRIGLFMFDLAWQGAWQ
tara:strand:+ start:2398 stop:2829 length:432 start_codon:yes stop_codon:yes gene_type:complete